MTEAGAPANFPPRGQAAYFYGQVLTVGDGPSHLSSQTGFALLNGLSAGPVNVSIQLTDLDGTVAGTGSLTLQPGQRRSMFLTEVPGLESLRTPFKGIVQVLAPDSYGLSVLALRGTVNERGDFLLSTTPSFVMEEYLGNPSFWGGTGFAHLVFGQGYTTEFVGFSNQFMDVRGLFGPPNSGSMSFVGPLGKSNLLLQ